jgi:hypothetical protein
MGFAGALNRSVAIGSVVRMSDGGGDGSFAAISSSLSDMSATIMLPAVSEHCGAAYFSSVMSPYRVQLSHETTFGPGSSPVIPAILLVVNRWTYIEYRPNCCWSNVSDGDPSSKY